MRALGGVEELAHGKDLETLAAGDAEAVPCRLENEISPGFRIRPLTVKVVEQDDAAAFAG